MVPLYLPYPERALTSQWIKRPADLALASQKLLSVFLSPYVFLLPLQTLHPHCVPSKTPMSPFCQIQSMYNNMWDEQQDFELLQTSLRLPNFTCWNIFEYFNFADSKQYGPLAAKCHQGMQETGIMPWKLLRKGDQTSEGCIYQAGKRTMPDIYKMVVDMKRSTISMFFFKCCIHLINSL